MISACSRPRTVWMNASCTSSGSEGGKPVQVHLLRPQPFRFDEHLVPVTLGEADYLVLDGRAVPWPFADDLASVQRAAADVLPDDPMGLAVRPRDVAGYHRAIHRIVIKRERHDFLVGILLFHDIQIQRTLAYPCRSAGLQAPHVKPFFPQGRSQSDGSRLIEPPAGCVVPPMKFCLP
jgi:hypothetical protein